MSHKHKSLLWTAVFCHASITCYPRTHSASLSLIKSRKLSIILLVKSHSVLLALNLNWTKPLFTEVVWSEHSSCVLSINIELQQRAKVQTLPLSKHTHGQTQQILNQSYFMLASASLPLPAWKQVKKNSSLSPTQDKMALERHAASQEEKCCILVEAERH